jgi:PilZ domain
MKQLVPRKFERRRSLGELLVRPLPGNARFGANAINLNPGGVALFSSRGLSVGQSVELFFGGVAAKPDDGKVLGRVAYISAQNEGNLIGIAFARVLDAEEMRALETKLRNQAN